MYKIYESSMVCVILPGGIRRLVNLSEGTDWIHRGWTLQEALAPKKAMVLFHFLRSSFRGGDEVHRLLENCEIYDKPVSQCSLYLMHTNSVSALTFSTHYEPKECNLLFTALTPEFSVTLRHEIQTSNAAKVKFRGHPRWREQAIWQASWMRTVDMVFSIMQMFDVNLDTTKFGKNERLKATIALASELTRRGRTAS
ncbi:hypothetical protein L218DRAFT_944998 [Marasmius fiardii PR-910]|nr:hypothetical protein L218DRAFT_944998 [Marasmius fiardii PR-910]